MDAVNRYHRKDIFSQKEISEARHDLFATFNVKLEADTVLRKINFKTGTVIKFYGNGQMDLKLVEDTLVAGIAFKKETKLAFDTEGKLRSASLSGETEIKGKNFKTGDEIFFEKNGEIEGLELTWNYIYKGIMFKKNTHTHFFPNRDIIIGTLLEDTNIKVLGRYIKFKGGNSLWFNKGRVAVGTLA